jgi:hypothetical protein
MVDDRSALQHFLTIGRANASKSDGLDAARRRGERRHHAGTDVLFFMLRTAEEMRIIGKRMPSLSCISLRQRTSLGRPSLWRRSTPSVTVSSSFRITLLRSLRAAQG